MESTRVRAHGSKIGIGLNIGLALVTIAATATVGGASAVASLRQPKSGRSITLGNQTLTHCHAGPMAYCASIKVPLDYDNPGGAEISIFYRWYPATDPQGGGHRNGGPGRRWSRVSVDPVGRRLRRDVRPLLKNFNMLSVDLRGTGKSTLLNCPGLQTFSGQASGPSSTPWWLLCRQPRPPLKYPNGTYVEASDLFSSAPAANDSPPSSRSRPPQDRSLRRLLRIRSSPRPSPAVTRN